MDPFGWTPEQATAAATWVTALATAATFVVLLVTAIYAARQFKETKELRRAQTRPYVVPSIDVEQQMLFMFRVENVGTAPAYNVRIEFDETPRSEMRDPEDLRLLKEPIPTMDARAKDGLKGVAQYWTDVWRRRHGLWSR